MPRKTFRRMTLLCKSIAGQAPPALGGGLGVATPSVVAVLALPRCHLRGGWTRCLVAARLKLSDNLRETVRALAEKRR